MTVKQAAGGLCGFGAEHLRMGIGGDPAQCCGALSHGSAFYLNCVGPSIGLMKSSNGAVYAASGCMFAVYKKELYDKLLNELPQGNKAVLCERKTNKVLEEKMV